MNKKLLTIGKKILEAREKRYLKKMDFANNYKCIIEVSLNVPGIPKNGAVWRITFDKCVENIKMSIPCELLMKCADFAGYYAVFNSFLPLEETKIRSCLIEEGFVWGRLVDIDCSSYGKKISRQEIGRNERLCFLCNKPNSICIAKHTHKIEELRNKAEEICIKTSLEGDELNYNVLEKSGSDASYDLIVEAVTPKPTDGYMIKSADKNNDVQLLDETVRSIINIESINDKKWGIRFNFFHHIPDKWIIESRLEALFNKMNNN